MFGSGGLGKTSEATRGCSSEPSSNSLNWAGWCMLQSSRTARAAQKAYLEPHPP